MDDLNAVFLFIKVTQQQSFVGAARVLDVPKSTVSLKINELEQKLGVRLFHRTTRRVSLTEAGRIYYENCLPIVDALDEANSAIASLQGQPVGVLRLTAPILFIQQFLAPILPEFLVAYPDLRVILFASNERKDLIEEGYDLAIRVGELEDSTFIMQHISHVCLRLVASKAYLKLHAPPTKIDELKEHSLLSTSRKSQNKPTWILENDQHETYSIQFHPRLVANDMTPIYHAVLTGLGIGLLPEFLCRSELGIGALVKVLPTWSSLPIPINVIYPSRKYLPKKVIVFLNFLIEKIGVEPR